jgi:hypothetical protein
VGCFCGVFPLIFAIVPDYVMPVQLNWNGTYTIAHNNNKCHVQGFQKVDRIGRYCCGKYHGSERF